MHTCHKVVYYNNHLSDVRFLLHRPVEHVARLLGAGASASTESGATVSF